MHQQIKKAVSRKLKSDSKNIFQLFVKSVLFHLRKFISKTFPKLKVPSFAVKFSWLSQANITIDCKDLIDSEKSTAAAYLDSHSNHGAISLNISDENNYESVRENIIKELQDIRDPSSDKRIVTNVWKREAIYADLYTEHLDDIIF